MQSIVLAFTVVVSLAFPAPGRGQSPSSPMQPCTIADVNRPVECGRISVPENRNAPKGRRIDLHVVIIKAPQKSTALPVVFFAGGPGQGAATLAAPLMRDLAAVTPDRDVVLIDQRGTGQSHLLTCEDGFLALDRARRDDFNRCRDAITRVADVQHYGTNDSADDVADVLRALGHSRVDVIGASYGTRLGLRFMQRHPAMVNSAVLRAVAPHGFNILADGARYSREALTRVFADCRADAACHAAFPELEAEFTRLRTQLREQGAPITADRFDQVVYALLLSTPTRQMLPWLIHTSLADQGAALKSISGMVDATYKTVAAGAYLSVACAEDAPFVKQTPSTNDGFDAATAAIFDACASWPVKAVTPAPLTKLAQPTLIISGTLDPAMPPAVGGQALGELSRGRHIIAPATAHGPLFPGCVPDLVRQFLANSEATLDAGCTAALTTPPFRVK